MWCCNRILRYRQHCRRCYYPIDYAILGRPIFTAQRCVSAVYAVFQCLSDRLSHAGIVSKLLKALSCRQRGIVAQRIYFSGVRYLDENPTKSLLLRGRNIHAGRKNLRLATDNSPYPGKGIRQEYSYRGGWIETQSYMLYHYWYFM